MSNSYSVFTWLKNLDLHCVSAKEALIDMMNVSYIDQLFRLQHYKVTLDGDLDDLRQILDSTYYIMNPNKEFSCIESFPEFIKGNFFHVESQPKYPTGFDEKINSINSKTKIKVSDISHSTLWIITSSKSFPEKDTLYKDIVSTTSVKNGLLVNPIYETILSYGFKYTDR